MGVVSSEKCPSEIIATISAPRRRCRPLNPRINARTTLCVTELSPSPSTSACVNELWMASTTLSSSWRAMAMRTACLFGAFGHCVMLIPSPCLPQQEPRAKGMYPSLFLWHHAPKHRLEKDCLCRLCLQCHKDRATHRNPLPFQLHIGRD